jgi:xylulose-5-phosphate/fructose-6-phosphate phosphoketolase
MHQKMATALDAALEKIRAIQTAARAGTLSDRPIWPMIVLRSPKGWTGPKLVDGLKAEGSWRAHQVPFSMDKPEHLQLLEEWMRSYRPEELFDQTGRLRPEIAALAPSGNRRMSANPHANGGALMRPLRMPRFEDHAVPVLHPGQADGEATKVMGGFLGDVMRKNAATRNFRVFGPDETASNRLQDLFGATGRAWDAAVLPDDDEHLNPDGRVMEILSEHTCQGWLEGYLLTGRHGLFNCYEAFIHIVDSMFNQHAKWLKTSREVEWRRPIASLNYLLTSHVWRQDHNGFSHQDPGFVDHVVNKKADTVRVYFPPDVNTLLFVIDHCLRSWDRVNVIVAGKQPQPQWLDMDTAIKHCTQGIGIWDWAGNDRGGEPDVVMACAGDVPTLETMAAVDLLRHYFPDLKVRVVNVVDLMTLQSKTQHPHGLTDNDFDALFTKDKPVIFAFHGYPTLIHRLTYKRTNHDNLHVRGFVEEGTTTTPFDMVVRNRLDRFHIVEDVIDCVPKLGVAAVYAKQAIRDKLIDHQRYIVEHGVDMPEVHDWRWPHAAPQPAS